MKKTTPFVEKINARVPTTMVLPNAWAKYRDFLTSTGRRVGAGNRAAFEAGFNSGLLVAEKVRSQLKIQESLKQRALKLEVENIALKRALRGARTTLNYIHRTTAKHKEEEA